MEKYYKIITIIISIIMISFLLCFFAFPKKEYSENEFRYLAKMPEISLKSITKKETSEKIEDYITDHFPLREKLVEIKTDAYLLSGQYYINNVFIGDNGYLINSFKTPSNLEQIKNNLNKFVLNNKNININLMFVPTSISINEKYLPKNAIYDKETEAINYLYDNINTSHIDLYDALINSQEDYLYYKTDHHWTMKGAYVAYKKYCQKNNLPIIDFDIKEVNNQFLGTTYSKVFYFKDKDIIYTYETNNKFKVYDGGQVLDSLYDKSYLDTKDKYSFYLGGNKPTLKIENLSRDDNSSLLIIKDSYANSFATLIANNYKYVHLIDPRYINASISDYIKDNDIKDVLILYNINTLESDIGINRIR